MKIFHRIQYKGQFSYFHSPFLPDVLLTLRQSFTVNPVAPSRGRDAASTCYRLEWPKLNCSASMFMLLARWGPQPADHRNWALEQPHRNTRHRASVLVSGQHASAHSKNALAHCTVLPFNTHIQLSHQSIDYSRGSSPSLSKPSGWQRGSWRGPHQARDSHADQRKPGEKGLHSSQHSLQKQWINIWKVT